MFLVSVVLVVVALVDVVHVARLIAVVLVGVALVLVVRMLVGMVLVGVALVDVVHVARLVAVVFVRVALVRVVMRSYSHFIQYLHVVIETRITYLRQIGKRLRYG